MAASLSPVDLKDLMDKAVTGHLRSQCQLGDYFYKGSTDKEKAESLKYYKQAADQSDEEVSKLDSTEHARASFNAGVAYEKGLGVPKNLVEAQKYYKLAAERGNVLGAENLAVLYYTNVPPNYPESMKYFKLAADLGSGQCLRSLGIWHVRGEHGLQKDFEVAADYLKRAAAKGDLSAHFMLGSFYHGGHGVPVNIEKAIHHYREASKLGEIQADLLLAGIFYTGGPGVPPDYREAAKHSQSVIASEKATVEHRLQAQTLLNIIKLFLPPQPAEMQRDNEFIPAAPGGPALAPAQPGPGPQPTAVQPVRFSPKEAELKGAEPTHSPAPAAPAQQAEKPKAKK